MKIELFSVEELTTLEALEVKGGKEKDKDTNTVNCGANNYCPQSGNCVAGCACSG